MTPLRAVLARCLRGLPTAVPDRDLLRAAADGDADAFRALVERHGPMVLRLCRRWLGDRHAAEDAFQATFLVLARKAGSLRRPEALAAWLFGVTRRVAAKARAADARRRQREARVVPRPPPDPLDELTARELFDALDEELARLPERYRLPLLLVYWQGLTQDETARRLGWTPGSVKGRLERGRARLAQRLTRRGFAPSALLAAPLAAAAVPADLLARTAALAADPWSQALPATVLALAATAAPAKLLPAMALGTLIIGAGLFAAAWRAGSVSDRSESQPPVADAPGSPADLQPDAPRLDRFGDPLPPGALLRLGSGRWRNSDGRGGEAPPMLTRDGRAIVTIIGNAVVLIDFETGRELRRFASDTGFRAFTLPAGSSTLVTAEAYGYRPGPDGRAHRVEDRGGLRVWDLATGQQRRHIPTELDATRYLVADRQYVAIAESAGKGAGTVFVYELNTGREVLRYGGPDTADGHCAPVGFVPGADRLVVRVYQNRDIVVRVLDLTNRQVLWSQTFNGFATRQMALSPDGLWLWVGTYEPVVRLWDTATGREREPLRGHEGNVQGVTFAANGRSLVTSGLDNTLRRWDLATGRELGRVTTQAVGVYHLSLSADDRRLIGISSEENLTRRYDLAAGRELPPPDGHTSVVWGLAFAPDGRTLFSGSADGTVRVWDLTTGDVRRSWRANHRGGAVELLALSPDGRRLVTVGTLNDPTARVWDAATGEAAGTITAPPAALAITALAFTPDGRTLALSSLAPTGGGIRLWDVVNGTFLRALPGPTAADGSLAVTADGRLLVAGGNTNKLPGAAAPPQLFDLASGRLLRSLDSPAGTLALSPDGRMLAGTDSSPDRPRPVCLVELASGRERLRFGQHAYWGAPLAFSPNGRWLAGPSESKDGRTGRDVVLWDVSTGHEVHHFAGSGSLTTFAFAPNGRTLASTGFDSTILVWDMTTIRPSRAAAPAPADLPALWDALASDNAAMAYRAIIALRSAEGQAVELLRGKLLPAAPIPAQRLAQLITDLDSPRFVTRQEAEKELIRLADFAAAALQRALVNNPSVELRQRIEKLLKALDLPLKDAELLRQLRAVEVLEHIGTPAAQQLLAELAKGDPEARLTRESQASLERVKRRNP